MYQNMFVFGCNGTTGNDPPSSYPPQVTLTVTITNGTFVLDEYAVVSTYGEPQGMSGTYPLVQFNPLPNSMQFSGNVNAMYLQMTVESGGETLVGNVTAEPAIPVEVFVSTTY